MRLAFPPYPRSGPSHDALRHWIDTAGTWHVQVEPEQLAHAGPVHLALLQSRLLALLDIVERITDPSRRRTGNPNVASLDEVMDFVSQVFPERAGGELRPVAAAAIEGIWEEIAILHHWAAMESSGFGADGEIVSSIPDDVSEAAHRLYHISMETEEHLNMVAPGHPEPRWLDERPSGMASRRQP